MANKKHPRCWFFTKGNIISSKLLEEGIGGRTVSSRINVSKKQARTKSGLHDMVRFYVLEIVCQRKFVKNRFIGVVGSMQWEIP